MHSDPTPSSVLWSTAQWLETAVGWIDARLAAAGRLRTGPAEQQRIRPWSTLLRVPTDGGVVWFKACTPAASYEAATVSALARVAPGRVPAPLAVDADRGWLLLSDGGPTLRETVTGAELLAVWADVLRAYAELQRSAERTIPELVRAGVPHLPPAALPSTLDALLARWDVDTPARPEVVAAAGRLATSAIPETIQHDDFHSANVLAGASGRDAPVVFDWGDAYVGHPFGSLLVGVSTLSFFVGHELTDDEVRRLHDAYLEPWLDLAPRAVLDDELRDALTVAPIGRVLGWERALSAATADELAQWRDGVREWVAELIEPVESTPVGRA